MRDTTNNMNLDTQNAAHGNSAGLPEDSSAPADRARTLSKLNKVYGICLLILSLCLAIGTQFTFHACGIHEDGSYGRCHYAQLVLGCLGGLMAVGAIQIPLLKSREATIAIAVITACEACFALIIPDTLIPLCMMASMPCRAMMKPFTMAIASTILLISVIGLIVAVRRKEK